MFPSMGGNQPPDPPHNQSAPKPQEPVQFERRPSSSSENHTNASDEKSPNVVRNNSKTVLAASVPLQKNKKTGKGDRNRRQLASFTIHDVLPEAGIVTVKNNNLHSDRTGTAAVSPAIEGLESGTSPSIPNNLPSSESLGQEVASPEDMDTGSGMSTPLIVHLPSSNSNLAMAANATSRDLDLHNHPPTRPTGNPLTPSKSQCTVNCASLVIPSPVKIGDLLCEESLFEEQMCDSETEEHDISDLEVPPHIDLSEPLYAQKPSTPTVQQQLEPSLAARIQPIPNPPAASNQAVPTDQNKPVPVSKPSGPPPPCAPYPKCLAVDYQQLPIHS